MSNLGLYVDLIHGFASNQKVENSFLQKNATKYSFNLKRVESNMPKPIPLKIRYYVDGKQSGTERQNILEEFANNTPSLVTNAQCLSEGVNVPSIDAIMFVDPKQSRVDITQAIGRALRKGNKNKGKSYIIVPVVVDKDKPENINEAYQQILKSTQICNHIMPTCIKIYTNM